MCSYRLWFQHTQLQLWLLLPMVNLSGKEDNTLKNIQVQKNPAFCLFRYHRVIQRNFVQNTMEKYWDNHDMKKHLKWA